MARILIIDDEKSIRKTLADNRYELQEQQKSSTLPDGSKNPFDRFPKWGSGIVPEIYKPRTIERILVDFAD